MSTMSPQVTPSSLSVFSSMPMLILLSIHMLIPMSMSIPVTIGLLSLKLDSIILCKRKDPNIPTFQNRDDFTHHLLDVMFPSFDHFILVLVAVLFGLDGGVVHGPLFVSMVVTGVGSYETKSSQEICEW